MTTTLTDAQLVASQLAGDPSALAAIYDRYADSLHDTAAAMLNDRSESADVLHDVVLIAAERLDQLRDPDRLKPWLFAILRNEVYRRTKQRRRTIATDFNAPQFSESRFAGPAGLDMGDDGPADPGESVVDDVGGEELAELVRNAARGLDDRDQLVLELSLRQGLDGQDLADALGVSANQSYTLVHRMRERVERSLTAFVVAKAGRKDCDDLDAMLASWDGEFTVLIRKRVARHIDNCAICDERRGTVAALGLFAGAPVYAAPPALRDRVLAAAKAVAAAPAIPYGFGADGGFPKVVRAGRRVAAWVAPTAAASLVLVVAMASFVWLDRGESPQILLDATGSAATSSSTSSPTTEPPASTTSTAVPVVVTVDAEPPATNASREPTDGAPATEGTDGASGTVSTIPPKATPPSSTSPPAPPPAPAPAPTPTTIRPAPAPTPTTVRPAPAPTPITPAPTNPPAPTPAPTTPAAPTNPPPVATTTTTTSTTAAPPIVTTTTTAATTTVAPAPGRLSVSGGLINLGSTANSGSVTVTNTGGQPVDYSINGAAAPFTISPSGATLAPGQAQQVVASINRSNLSEGQMQFANVQITGGGDTFPLDLQASVERAPVISGGAPTAQCFSTEVFFSNSASISDESSISATFSMSGPLGSKSGSMTFNGSWFGSLSFTYGGATAPNGNTADGTWNWSVTATDSRGNASTASGTIQVDC